MVNKLEVVDAETLMATPMNRTLFIVDELIPQGLVLLSGPPKVGKSWFVLDLALNVAQGKPVLDFPTYQCDVLYLCLEDTKNRIKDRLYQLSDYAPQNLFVSVASNCIGGGLEKQISMFIKEHPNTRLIIIDTFQKVRNCRASFANNGMYANDYNDMSALKSIADKYNLAIILVHHLRKLQDANDPFNEVSGSTGIVGAVDTNLVMKRKRSSMEATLYVSGRDVQYQELTLEFNRLHWKLIEKKNEEEIHKAQIPEFIFNVIDFIKQEKTWVGTATELLEQMHETDVPANMVTKYLGRFGGDVMDAENIGYRTKRTGKKRLIYFVFRGADDDNDENDGKFTI